MVVSLECLAQALRDIRLDQVASVILKVNGWWVMLTVLSILVILFIKSARWHKLFSVEKRSG